MPLEDGAVVEVYARDFLDDVHEGVVAVDEVCLHQVDLVRHSGPHRQRGVDQRGELRARDGDERDFLGDFRRRVAEHSDCNTHGRGWRSDMLGLLGGAMHLLCLDVSSDLRFIPGHLILGWHLQ